MIAAAVSSPLESGSPPIGAPPRLRRETRSFVLPSGTRSAGSDICPSRILRGRRMVGVLLALGSAATWGCGDFLSGLMSRRLPLLSVLLATQAAGVPFVLVV